VPCSSPLKPQQATVRITSPGASSGNRLSHVNGNRCEADVLLGNYGNEFPRQNAVLTTNENRDHSKQIIRTTICLTIVTHKINRTQVLHEIFR
jgi:hypothetical protein